MFPFCFRTKQISLKSEMFPVVIEFINFVPCEFDNYDNHACNQSKMNILGFGLWCIGWPKKVDHLIPLSVDL